MSTKYDAILGKIREDDTTDVSGYLPLTGGTLTGSLGLSVIQGAQYSDVTVSLNNGKFVVSGGNAQIASGNNLLLSNGSIISELNANISIAPNGTGITSITGATEISSTLKATRIGLGGSNPESTRLINADGTFGDGGAFGFNAIIRANPDTTNSDYYFGGYVSAQSTSGSTNGAAGFRGIKTFGEHNGTGTIGSVYGAEFQVGNTNTGTINSAVGFKLLAPYNTGGGTIGDYIGLEIETTTIGRSLVVRGGKCTFNDYEGDYDFNIKGDTDYNLFYLNAGTDRIGIGHDNPNNKLDVNGTVQADGLRLDVTPTSETITPTHTITISVNGTNYKLPCVAA